MLEYLHSTQDGSLPPVPALYNISEISQTPQCYTNFEPSMTNSIGDILVLQHSNWKRGLSFLDAAAVEKSILKGYGYIDRKYIYTSTGQNSTLTFVVRVRAASPVWLCEVQKGFAKYPASAADLNEGAEVYVALNYVEMSDDAPSGNSTDRLAYWSPDFARMQRVGENLWLRV
jgi:hypothetical protein